MVSGKMRSKLGGVVGSEQHYAGVVSYIKEAKQKNYFEVM